MHAFALSSDWFVVLFAFVLIGQRVCLVLVYKAQLKTTLKQLVYSMTIVNSAAL